MKPLLSGFLLASTVFAAPVFLGPTPYLSPSDSPLATVHLGYFYLESFDSGSMTVPGVSVSSGAFITSPGPLVDSVDDTDIRSAGLNGRSLYSGGFATSIRFTFDASALRGHLPTHVGIVWTDVGAVSSGAFATGDVVLRAFGRGGVLLGETAPAHVGDGLVIPGSEEDRFFGVYDPNGISAFEITMPNSADWEVDHLQYGSITASPEPGTYALGAAGVLLLYVRRRLSRRQH